MIIDRTCTISCTLMVQLVESPMYYTSHTFTSLVLAMNYFADRGGVTAITASTLFAALVDSAALHTPIEPAVQGILARSLLYADHNVSTLRVPSFDPADMQNPLHGYRFLGQLQTIQTSSPTLPAEHFSAAHDVLAVHASYGDIQTEQFANMWGPAGVDLKTHFMLIVSRPPSMSPAFPLRSSSSPFADGFMALLSPAPASTSNWNNSFMPDHEPINSLSPSIPSAIDSFLNNTAPHTSIESVLHNCTISSAQIESARYISRGKNLCVMVTRHRLMSELLQSFGLHSHDAIRTCSSGFELQAVHILEHLGWATQTYQNKTRYYASAALVASQQWNGGTPSKSSDAVHSSCIECGFSNCIRARALQYMESHCLVLEPRRISMYWS